MSGGGTVPNGADGLAFRRDVEGTIYFFGQSELWKRFFKKDSMIFLEGDLECRDLDLNESRVCGGDFLPHK